MAREWVERTISDLGNVVGGSTPSTADPTNFDGDVPWLTPKDLSGTHSRYVRRGERNLTKKGLASCSAQMLPTNSVLLSSRAPIGYVAIAANPMATNQGFRSLVLKQEYDHEFVYYWLKANVEELERHSSGSTFKELSGSAYKQIRIVLPSELGEQRAIARVLGALDDKIELNRRMDETLEAMARALFKSWFVDFDPVHAKADGRDIDLPTHLADLFPETLEDSELGEIPKGWEVRGLDEIARFLNGLALQKYPAGDGESLPVIKIAQLRAGHTSGSDRASIDLPPDYVVDDGDVLFSWSGSLEVALWAAGKGALNQHLFRVTSNKYPKWFYYLWICHHLPEFRRIAAAKATTMGHIQRHHLSEAKVAVPPQDVIDGASQYIAPLIDSLPALRVQSRLLAVARDELLPKLVSGEVRLVEPTAFLGERA